ncbi:DUF4435 domain-containing protein [Rossellomorea marisflavi]|uniref:DUF4435 domain-containing protein n=1 Tax=Rossellomorea marisflavi TaxID=189381 RepID=UPI00345B41FC
MVNALPKRKEESIFAEIKLKYRNNDIFLFIEDEKMPEVYRKIITRLFKEIKIGNIYSLKSKKNVLDKFEDWLANNSQLEKCIFIVDRDFDHLKGKISPKHSNLIELESYTIENYLIGKEEAISLMKVKIFNLEHQQLEHLLDWEVWISYVFNSFKRLFIAYAIANKYEVCENCGISPHRYLVRNTDEINEDQIIDYIEELRKICETTPGIEFEKEFKDIERFFHLEHDEYDYHALIKGKYLFAALLKHLHHITGKKFDEDMSALIIADNISLKKFSFLKQKIIEVFSSLGDSNNYLDHLNFNNEWQKLGSN